MRLEPCNYIRGFILLEYTKRFNEFLDVLKRFLKIIVTELAWRGWDLNPLLLFIGLYATI
ncbi:MAG TPA: hypothetical protein VEW92_02070 [Nitrososphaeraceae archaeon]|nr:hypothetical protein [Nitrososphaeraceae archaeon]